MESPWKFKNDADTYLQMLDAGRNSRLQRIAIGQRIVLSLV
jgi:hypothetical protein